MSRQGTVGRMTTGTSDGVGRNRVLAVATTTATTTATAMEVVMIDRT